MLNNATLALLLLVLTMVCITHAHLMDHSAKYSASLPAVRGESWPWPEPREQVHPSLHDSDPRQVTHLRSRKNADGSQTDTYVSIAFFMKQGEVVNSDPENTPPFLAPAGRIAVTEFYAQVVDSMLRPVPLSEVYLHHWILGGAGPKRTWPCPGAFNIGGGAETRHTFVGTPRGYGFITDSSLPWWANIHMIDTRDVTDVKRCIECACETGGGGIECCQGGSFCPLRNGTMPESHTRYIMYDLTWTKPETVIPVDLHVLDVVNCRIEFDVTKQPGCTRDSTDTRCVQVTEGSVKTPTPMRIVGAVGHLHIGGKRLTLEVRVGGANSSPVRVCENVPQIGTGSLTDVGNERGYVVGISECVVDPPIDVPAGSILTTRAEYYRDDNYYAVMGLMNLVVTDIRAGTPSNGDRVNWLALTLAGLGGVVLLAAIVLLIRVWRAGGSVSTSRHQELRESAP